MQELKTKGLLRSESSLQKNNKIIQEYSELLKNKGVHTEMYESDSLPGFFNLKIVILYIICLLSKNK